MLHSSVPLSFVEVCPFLCTVAVHLIVAPGALIDPTIDEVENALSVLSIVPHVSLVPFPVFGYEYSFARCLIILPFPEVYISTIGLEDTSAVSLAVLQLPLVRLPRGVLQLPHILEKLGIGAIDVILQEALDDTFLFLVQSEGIDRSLTHNRQITKIIQMTHSCRPSWHTSHIMSTDLWGSSSRHSWQMRQPHDMFLQAVNFLQFTHPMTLMIEGAVSISSWLSIFRPSAHMGALDEMSRRVQLPFTSQLEHAMTPRLIIPLQKVSLCCFLQPLQASLRDTLMGETEVWSMQFKLIYLMLSIGFPSRMEQVEILNCGGQFNQDYPSMEQIRMLSPDRLTKANFSMTVQNYSGGRLLLLCSQSLIITLPGSRVNCSEVNCLPPTVDKFFLVDFMHLKSPLTELPSIEVMELTLPNTDSFFSSLTCVPLARERLVSGGSLSFTGGCCQLYFALFIDQKHCEQIDPMRITSVNILNIG